jgi:hypothetical protein
MQDNYRKCAKCAGWVNITERHVTATHKGKPLWFHADFCIDYTELQLEAITYHNQRISRHAMRLL